MKNILIICPDYKRVKEEMKKWEKKLKNPTVSLTEREIRTNGCLYIFKFESECPESIISLKIDGFHNCGAILDERSKAYIYTHLGRGE